MQFIKFAAILIACLAAYSLALWLLGLWSRRSIVAKIISSIFLFLSALVLAALYFVRPAIGTLTVYLQKGVVKEIREIDLSAGVKLEKYVQNANSLTVQDAKGRKFVATLPSNVTTSSTKVRIFPVDSCLVSFTFVMAKIKKFYIVATWGKLVAFVMSLLAVFIVWGAGTEGKFAFLLPGDD